MIKVIWLRLILLPIVISSSEGVNLKKLLGGGAMLADINKDDPNLETTCDMALAKALVQANEAKAATEAERDTALAEKAKGLTLIEELKTKLSEAHSNLQKNQVAQIEAKVQSEETLSQTQKLWTAKNEELQREHQERIASLQAAFEESLATKEREMVVLRSQVTENLAAGQKGIEDALQAKDNEIAALKDDASSMKAKLVKEAADALKAKEDEWKKQMTTLQGELAEVKEKAAKEIASLKEEAAKLIQIKELELLEKHDQKHAELEMTKKQAEEERLRLLKEKEEHAAELAAHHDSHKRSLEEKHNDVVTTLKLEMETKEKHAMNMMKAREEELESKMESIKLEAELQLKQKEGDHSKEREWLVKSIKDMERDHAELEKKISHLDSKYTAAAKEIDEWQALYQGRSYCNFTYIQEDAVATVASVSKVATAQIAVATVTVAKAATEQLSVAGSVLDKAAQPHISLGRQLYNEHVKEHVDTHLVPIYENILKPVYVNHIKPAFISAKVVITKLAKKAHNGMISEFKATCPQLKALAREHQFHPKVQALIRDKCQDPRNTVNRFLLGVAILLCLIFRKSLWRIASFTIYAPLRFLWYLTPLPLLFPSKKKKTKSAPPTIKNSSSHVVKVERNGKAHKKKK